MNKEVIYIPETKEFIINGKTIKEKDLTIVEANDLKRQAEQMSLLIDKEENESCNVLL